jgi:hypothetical protein
VKEGRFRSLEVPEGEDYLDQTLKFTTLIALIERLNSGENFQDFYDWLSVKERRNNLFPIADHANLMKLYADYKEIHGATKKVRKFFLSLDGTWQRTIADSVKFAGSKRDSSIETAVNLIYQMRSDFVHLGEPVLEWMEGWVITERMKNRKVKKVLSTLNLEDIMHAFEVGALEHFNIKPTKKASRTEPLK